MVRTASRCVGGQTWILQWNDELDRYYPNKPNPPYTRHSDYSVICVNGEFLMTAYRNPFDLSNHSRTEEQRLPTNWII